MAAKDFKIFKKSGGCYDSVSAAHDSAESQFHEKNVQYNIHHRYEHSQQKVVQDFWTRRTRSRPCRTVRTRIRSCTFKLSHSSLVFRVVVLNNNTFKQQIVGKSYHACSSFKPQLVVCMRGAYSTIRLQKYSASWPPRRTIGL